MTSFAPSASIIAACAYAVSLSLFFFQAEDGIRDLVRSRGLGDVYKRQVMDARFRSAVRRFVRQPGRAVDDRDVLGAGDLRACLLYTSDAADERSRVDLGGRRIIKKKKKRRRKDKPEVIVK